MTIRRVAGLTFNAGPLLIGFLLPSSCGPRAPAAQEPEYRGQSHAAAMSLICDVDRLAGLSAELDPIEIGQRRHDWLSERVKNPDAIYFRVVMRTKSGPEQAAMLRNEARVAGLRRCPLADSVERGEL
jgi:hypothetical protein